MQSATDLNQPRESAEASAGFVREVHDIVRDLLPPTPKTYWGDFLLSISTAFLAFAIYLLATDWSVLQIVSFTICALAMYRAAIFVHEIEHRPERSMRPFAVAWNVLCGIPFAMPSFLYHDHRGHHSNVTYGTPSDAEYLPLIRNRPLRATAFLAIAIVYPVLGPLRFLLLTPLMIVVPQANRLGWIYLSSMYMLNPSYRRPYNETASSAGRWIQELATCIFVWTIALLCWFEIVPVIVLVKTYLVFLAWIGLNQLRTLTAHRYGYDGEHSSHMDQALDSNTFPNGWILPELWAPVGLRYHALHHVLPSLPYHAMGAAHRRLVERLPADSPYRQTLQPGLWAAVSEAFVGPRQPRDVLIAPGT